MSVEVVLTTDEMLAATVVAAQRKITSDRRRAEGRESRNPEHYREDTSWDQEIESALAELAVARWRGRYWMGSLFNGSVVPDAGGYQVRWTAHELGHLIVYEQDDGDDPFVLVVGRSPRLQIVGWIYGTDARQERYWRDQGVKCPSWWVPQSALRAIDQ